VGIGFEMIAEELVTRGASLVTDARAIIRKLGSVLAQDEPYAGFVRQLSAPQ
jgi:hypothetical protein